jgi:hypothetical protein
MAELSASLVLNTSLMVNSRAASARTRPERFTTEPDDLLRQV